MGRIVDWVKVWTGAATWAVVGLLTLIVTGAWTAYVAVKNANSDIPLIKEDVRQLKNQDSTFMIEAKCLRQQNEKQIIFNQEITREIHERDSTQKMFIKILEKLENLEEDKR